MANIKLVPEMFIDDIRDAWNGGKVPHRRTLTQGVIDCGAQRLAACSECENLWFTELGEPSCKLNVMSIPSAAFQVPSNCPIGKWTYPKLPDDYRLDVDSIIDYRRRNPSNVDTSKDCSEEIVRYRLSICDQCEFRAGKPGNESTDQVCADCGCSFRYKTFSPNPTCGKGFWEK